MAGARSALVVASEDYSDPEFRRLSAPVNDAEDLARTLADASIGSFDVHTVVNRPSHEVRRRIEAFFADRARDDLLLLYFSGHGVKDENGRLFLAMSDTERKLLNATAVSAAFVRDAMGATRSRQTVLLLDCCYSGAFAAGTKGDAAVHTAERFDASGSVVITASDSLQYSFEDMSGRDGWQSVFTGALVEGLRTGAADLDADGAVSLDELYDYVHQQVVSRRPQQRPGKWETGAYGRIVLARNPRWVAPTAPTNPPDAAPESILESGRQGNIRRTGRGRRAHRRVRLILAGLLMLAVVAATVIAIKTLGSEPGGGAAAETYAELIANFDDDTALGCAPDGSNGNRASCLIDDHRTTLLGFSSSAEALRPDQGPESDWSGRLRAGSGGADVPRGLRRRAADRPGSVPRL